MEESTKVMSAVADSWEDVDKPEPIEKQMSRVTILSRSSTERQSQQETQPAASPFKPSAAAVILTSPEEQNRSQYVPEAKVLIMKRPSQESVGVMSSNGKTQQPIKTLEQRQAEYNEARIRILGNAEPEPKKGGNPDGGSSSSSSVTTTPSDSSDSNDTAAKSGSNCAANQNGQRGLIIGAAAKLQQQKQQKPERSQSQQAALSTARHNQQPQQNMRNLNPHEQARPAFHMGAVSSQFRPPYPYYPGGFQCPQPPVPPQGYWAYSPGPESYPRQQYQHGNGSATQEQWSYPSYQDPQVPFPPYMSATDYRFSQPPMKPFSNMSPNAAPYYPPEHNEFIRNNQPPPPAEGYTQLQNLPPPNWPHGCSVPPPTMQFPPLQQQAVQYQQQQQLPPQYRARLPQNAFHRNKVLEMMKQPQYQVLQQHCHLPDQQKDIQQQQQNGQGAVPSAEPLNSEAETTCNKPNMNAAAATQNGAVGPEAAASHSGAAKNVKNGGSNKNNKNKKKGASKAESESSVTQWRNTNNVTISTSATDSSPATNGSSVSNDNGDSTNSTKTNKNDAPKKNGAAAANSDGAACDESKDPATEAASSESPALPTKSSKNRNKRRNKNKNNAAAITPSLPTVMSGFTPLCKTLSDRITRMPRGPDGTKGFNFQR